MVMSTYLLIKVVKLCIPVAVAILSCTFTLRAAAGVRALRCVVSCTRDGGTQPGTGLTARMCAGSGRTASVLLSSRGMSHVRCEVQW